jgi:excisionase family DNA binding protein
VAVPPVEGSGMLDVVGAATYLGVTEAFVRRLVLERRVRYFKLGKFVRFRTADLDAFIEAGRHEPVAPWVHTRSTQRRATARTAAQQPKPSRQAGGSSGQQRKTTRR